MVKEIQQENTVTITRESERKHGNTLPYYYSVNLCNPSPSTVSINFFSPCTRVLNPEATR